MSNNELSQRVSDLVEQHQLDKVVDAIAQAAYEKYVAPEPSKESDRAIYYLEKAADAARSSSAPK